MNQNLIRLLTILCILPLSAVVMAHPEGQSASGFWSGLSHPFAGIDHMIVMFAVGLWAAAVAQRQVWLPVLSFMIFMLLGALLALAGFALPYVETGIAVSVLVVGLLLITLTTLPALGSVVVIGLFAIFHGHAHGTEMPAAAGLTYGLGFVLTTGLLHVLGIGTAHGLRKLKSDWLLRGAGLVSSGAGMWLLLNV